MGKSYSVHHNIHDRVCVSYSTSSSIVECSQLNVIPEPVLDVAVRNGLSGGDGVDYQKQKQIVGEFEVSVLSRTLGRKK